MKKLIYTNAQGTCCVVSPAYNDEVNGRKADESEKAFLKRIAKLSIPKGIKYQIMDKSSIPEDRTFRAAWQLESNRVEHNMKKARAIHLDSLRSLRNKKLVNLDLDFMKALEKGEDTKDIVAKKQELRDLPANVDLDRFKSAADLKDYKPSLLDD